MGSAPYPVNSKARDVCFAPGLIITSGNGAVATVTSDPYKVLDPTTPITYVGAGVNILNFREDWSYIGGNCNAQGDIGDMAYLSAPAYTKGANTIRLILWDESGPAVADIVGQVINIDLLLVR